MRRLSKEHIHPLFLSLGALFIVFGCEERDPQRSLDERADATTLDQGHASPDATRGGEEAQGGDPEGFSDEGVDDGTGEGTLDQTLITDLALERDMNVEDMSLIDSDMSGADDGRLTQVRAPCYLGGDPIETSLDPAPLHCIDLFNRAPELESGCYLMRQPHGEIDSGYCWRQRGLVFLVNNEIETALHPDDSDQDGVIDQGDQSGQNYPADPFSDLNPSEVATRLQQEVRDYMAELTYQSMRVDLEVYWAGEGTTERSEIPHEGELDREQWYRFLQLRPSFANLQFTQDLCRRRGGMSVEDWRAYDWIMTIVSHGTSTSGSQYREESLPTGEGCGQLEVVQGDYIVTKRFRSWNRLGTLFHEVIHTASLEPASEPSIGHSESVNPLTGELTEYGDLSDLMGRSSDRGHLSAPQKAFLRYLPPDMFEEMELGERERVVRVSPLEPETRRRDEVRMLRVEVDEGNAYHLEVRRPIGTDVNLPEIFHQGALIKRARELVRANKSFIVDPTPETLSANATDYVLLPHRTFTDESNQVHISALSADESGVELRVIRGPRSTEAPLIDEVNVNRLGDDDTDSEVSLSVSARPGDASISSDKLLYFWKLGPRGVIYTPALYRYGRELTLSAGEVPSELWLLVSDQHGGETWREVSLD